jgi:hypothetical protein
LIATFVGGARPTIGDSTVEYAITAALLLTVVAGSFTAAIVGGYGLAHLIVWVL